MSKKVIRFRSYWTADMLQRSHKDGENENGFKIKKGKLRGVESFGMMCSIEELRIYDETCIRMQPKDGIYILSDNPEYKDAPIGSDAIELLGLHDVTFEYEITSNRVDCFGVLGIAREAAATFGKKFVPPVVTKTGNDEDVNDYISVDVQRSGICVHVMLPELSKTSNWHHHLSGCREDWRLLVFVRSIILLILPTMLWKSLRSQCTHMIWIRSQDHKIVVRKANAGEPFKTLDGQERTLDDSMLMICDGKKPIGLAGIMGGENSMITDDVKTMLFEAATFDGTNIRLSGKKLGTAYRCVRQNLKRDWIRTMQWMQWIVPAS